MSEGETQASLDERELSLRDRKQKNSRRLAFYFAAFDSVLILAVCAAAIFMPNVLDALGVISEVVVTFVLASLGITGAYVGATAWPTRR